MYPLNVTIVYMSFFRNYILCFSNNIFNGRLLGVAKVVFKTTRLSQNSLSLSLSLTLGFGLHKTKQA